MNIPTPVKSCSERPHSKISIRELHLCICLLFYFIFFRAHSLPLLLFIECVSVFLSLILHDLIMNSLRLGCVSVGLTSWVRWIKGRDIFRDWFHTNVQHVGIEFWASSYHKLGTKVWCVGIDHKLCSNVCHPCTYSSHYFMEFSVCSDAMCF